MKKIAILLVALFALWGVDTANAQSRTSYFMEGSYFRSEFNPALAPTRGYFMIPGLSGLNLNVGTNFLSLDNFIFERDGQLVTALHQSVSADDFLKKLPDTLTATGNMNVNLLGVGLYTKKMFWSFGANLRCDNNVAISKDLFRVVKTFGNGVYDLGSTSMSANEYVEVYAGTSFPLFDWMTVGARAKFLIGLANLSAEFDKLILDVNENYVEAYMHGELNASSPILSNKPLASGDDYSMSDLLCYNDTALVKENLKSYGAAVDLGVEMRFLENHLKVSAAVTDLGFIRWSKTSHITGEVAGGAMFEGVVIGEEGLNEDLSSYFKPVDESGEFFDFSGIRPGEGNSRRLTCSVNAGVEYNMLKNKIALGVFSQTRFLTAKTAKPLSEVTASLNLRPTSWLSATVTHTMMVGGSNAGVFGAAINFHPALLNLYFGVDFIDSNWVKAFNDRLIIPRNAKSINLYMGAAFNFGRPKHLKGGEEKKARWK